MTAEPASAFFNALITTLSCARVGIYSFSFHRGLPKQESVHQFLGSVMSLVDASVNSYQRRGFKNLMVSFGCTGGQHRSVYLAEQVAKRLQGRNGIEVVVRHRELEKM